MVSLSKSEINTYLGDVVPLRLLGDGIGRDSEINWDVCGEAVELRRFSDEDKYAFTDGVLISTAEVGEATVYAEYAGKRYEARVSVRPMMDTDLTNGCHYYFADMHDHTSINHNHSEFALHENGDISDYIDCIRNDGRLDLSVISDHAGVTNDYDFFRGFELAEKCEKPVVMAGAESEVMYIENDRLGIPHRHSGEIVTLMSAGYADVKTWEEFEADMSYSKYGFAIFAHPHVLGYSTKGIWNFDYGRRRTPFMLKLMRGIEMGNGADRKENLLHEYAYPAALDAGFHVSTTCASDSHGSKWGYDIMPGKTVIMAKDGSKEALHEAFLKNRFYASETGNVKLRYTVNGVLAPCLIGECKEYKFHIELGSFREDESTKPILCQIISDYGKVAAEITVETETVELTVKSETARYFYLRLVDAEGRKTWSYPVWCGRKPDEEKDPMLEVIDMTGCTAEADGMDASTVINGDPFDPWYSDKATPVITVDLGGAMEVAGFGYYPLIIMRSKEKGPQWTSSSETRGMVSRYKLYTSEDGEIFEQVASEVVRTLGEENIIEFSPRMARYVRMEVLANVGGDSGLKQYSESKTAIANIAIFKKSTR